MLAGKKQTDRQTGPFIKLRSSSATPGTGVGVGVEIGSLELDNEFFVVVVAAVLDSSLGLGGGMIRVVTRCGRRRNHWCRFLPGLCRFVVVVFADSVGI